MVIGLTKYFAILISIRMLEYLKFRTKNPIKCITISITFHQIPDWEKTLNVYNVKIGHRHQNKEEKIKKTRINSFNYVKIS